MCNPGFGDDDFRAVCQIILCGKGKRQYAEYATDFVDLPPHHIAIQGKFIRLFHKEMAAAKVGNRGTKIVVAGLFPLRSRDGEATECGEESDEEPAMDDDIVKDVIS